MLDRDLAELYGVEVKQLKRQVKRNQDRFPADFMFQLSREEYNALRSQFGTFKRGEHSKYLPYAFTEQGVSMLSSVLRSTRAVQNPCQESAISLKWLKFCIGCNYGLGEGRPRITSTTRRFPRTRTGHGSLSSFSFRFDHPSLSPRAGAAAGSVIPFRFVKP